MEKANDYLACKKTLNGVILVSCVLPMCCEFYLANTHFKLGFLDYRSFVNFHIFFLLRYHDVVVAN